MPNIDIIDISAFRVRLNSGRRGQAMSDLHEVRQVHELRLDAAGWSTIPEATDSRMTLDGGWQRQRIFSGKFEERNPFNIPGPFYGAQTDTCETGPLEAPANVMLDEEGQEFVFRQPTNAAEIRQIIGAARCDPFSGYGADGDQQWTLRLIREWWSGLGGRTSQFAKLALMNKNIDPWLSLSTAQAEDYLRRYAFFVDNQRAPVLTDPLPDL